MAFTIDEGKEFVIDATKAREDFLYMADRSWNEIKKRTTDGKMWFNKTGSNKGGKYPAWFSILKIRQPLLMSRIGIPVAKDTTQDGNDNIGATAAICKERLAVALAKGFDFFDTAASARDDFLATNFGQVRGFYKCEDVKQRVKEYIQPQDKDDGTGQMEKIFIDANGKEVTSDEIMQDDEGFYLEHDKTIDIENEQIILKPVLPKDFLVDPFITSWDECERCAFLTDYSANRFKDIFGTEAFNDLQNVKDAEPGKLKVKNVTVIECWDKFEGECFWWAENGTKLIKPKKISDDDDEKDDYTEDCNGLYNLENLFPCPKPLRINAATDEFWPIPEYYQVMEILNDIHTKFSRMMGLSRAIRPRLLFDSNVEGLGIALSEGVEGEAFGVENLAKQLSGAGGNLKGVAQFIPVQEMIEAMSVLYTALEQQLQALFRLTGTSDLLQGLTQSNSDKTLGERQMEEKYAINQIADAQRKMQEFMRDCYELLCEMALKNFKDSSLDRYIMPQTLQPEHQERYRAALGMLKQDFKRFRIDLETDSTIAINENYDKAVRVELVNTLTSALEKTAQIAQSSPELVKVELQCLKYLIQGFRQGKMFQSEVTEAIDNVIKQTEDAAEKAPPPFDKDQEGIKIQAQELQINTQLKQMDLQSTERVEMAKLSQSAQIAQMESQLENFRLQLEQGKSSQELQIRYQELQSQMAKIQQAFAIAQSQLSLDAQENLDTQNLETFKAQTDAQLGAAALQLQQADQDATNAEQSLSLQERIATEQRLQEEHQNDQTATQIQMAATVHKMMEPTPAPKISEEVKITKDPLGPITGLEIKKGTK